MFKIVESLLAGSSGVRSTVSILVGEILSVDKDGNATGKPRPAFASFALPVAARTMTEVKAVLRQIGKVRVNVRLPKIQLEQNDVAYRISLSPAYTGNGLADRLDVLFPITHGEPAKTTEPAKDDKDKSSKAPSGTGKGK